MLKKILVPLDGSLMAERALQPARALAEAARGEIILLRSMIVVHMAMPAFAGEYDWLWPEDSDGAMRREVESYLEHIRDTIARPRMHVVTEVAEGSEAAAILDAASEHNVDLIAMTSHGRTGVRRWLMGSVTERVLHYATCPVMVLRHEHALRHILVALDGSELAERVLEPALDVASCLDADVTLLRVLPTGLGYQEASDYLDGVRRRHANTGVRMTPKVLEGPVVDTILDFVEAEKADLVAMTTHGRTGLRRWVYGSVTSKIMRGTEGAMLIVRPPSQALRD